MYRQRDSPWSTSLPHRIRNLRNILSFRPGLFSSRMRFHKAEGSTAHPSRAWVTRIQSCPGQTWVWGGSRMLGIAWKYFTLPHARVEIVSFGELINASSGWKDTFWATLFPTNPQGCDEVVPFWTRSSSKFHPPNIQSCEFTSGISRCQLICLLQSRSKKRGPRWPPNLRLVCIHININSEHLHEPAWEWENTLVDLLAKSIPAIRVVKIMDSYRNVYNFWSTDLKNIPAKECVDGAWPIPSYVKRMQWDSRQGTVMRNEMLERHDCEDTWFEEG